MDGPLPRVEQGIRNFKIHCIYKTCDVSKFHKPSFSLHN